MNTPLALFVAIGATLFAACSDSTSTPATTSDAGVTLDGGAGSDSGSVDAGTTTDATTPTDGATNTDAALSGTCATLPAGTTYTGGPLVAGTGNCQTRTTGKWTKYFLNTDANTASVQCDVEDAAVPTSQASFDGSLAGTATSNHDFARGAACASGSFVYSPGGTPIHTTYIWQKNP